MIGTSDRTDEWLREHYSTIGGSSAATAIGKGRFKTPRKLYDQMRGVRDGQIPRVRLSDDMRRGSVLEPVARQLLAEHHQCSVEEHSQEEFVYNGAYKWAHVLPDGWIAGSPVELKVPRPGTIARCNTEGLIEEWFIQCQHTLAITGTVKCYVGLLDPMTAIIHPFEVDRDNAFIGRIMEAEHRFWDQVCTGNPPDEGPLPDTGELGPARKILDSDEVQSAALTYLRLRDIFDDAESAKKAAQVQLVKLAGGAQAWEVPGVLRVYHRPWPGAWRFDTEKAIEKYPDLAKVEYYKRSAPSRPFKPYDLRGR